MYNSDYDTDGGMDPIIAVWMEVTNDDWQQYCTLWYKTTFCTILFTLFL